MADHIRNLKTDYSHPVVDNNSKLEDGADPPAVQLALFQDVFGNVLDGHWTECAPLLGVGVEIGTVTESGNKIAISVPGAAGKIHIKAIRTPYVYNDTVVQSDIENFTAAPIGGEAAYCELFVYKNANNHARIFRYRSAAANKIYWRVVVGGVTFDSQSVNIVATTLKLKIQRAGNNWTAWYDVGAGWVQISTAAANNRNIGADCAVIIGARTIGAVAVSFDVQKMLPTGYYWDDSPESTIREFDAGVGETWVLTGCSDDKDPDGGTTFYKGQHSNDGVIWTTVDPAWQTIAQLDTNAVAGNYDGHRYVRFLAQFNSTGIAQPKITSFTMSGAPAVSAIAGPFGNLNYLLGGVA